MRFVPEYPHALKTSHWHSQCLVVPRFGRWAGQVKFRPPRNAPRYASGSLFSSGLSRAHKRAVCAWSPQPRTPSGRSRACATHRRRCSSRIPGSQRPKLGPSYFCGTPASVVRKVRLAAWLCRQCRLGCSQSRHVRHCRDRQPRADICGRKCCHSPHPLASAGSGSPRRRHWLGPDQPCHRAGRPGRAQRQLASLEAEDIWGHNCGWWRSPGCAPLS